MGIRVRRGRVEISGKVNFSDLYLWALNNTSHAKALSEDTVELLTQTVVKNNSTLDTSYSTLILNHRLEDDRKSTNASSKWICNKGIVSIKGSASMYSEYWVPQIWKDVQVIINKPNGRVSFFRSERCSGGVLSTIRDVKYFIRSGEVDAHLQLCGGVGILKNTLIESDDSRGGFLLVRDTDTDGIVIKGLDLGGWNSLSKATTFHKNMVMDHGTGSDASVIPFLYRRKNNPIFYNVLNHTTLERKREVHYRNPDAWSGTGRAVIVGKFAPVIVNTDGEPASNVSVSIAKVSDGTVEHFKKTDSTGKVEIRNNSWDAQYTSLVWENRKIYEAGTCYVKQAYTSKSFGPQQSTDQGDFLIRIRKPDLVPYEVTKDFHSDMVGEAVMFTDDKYRFSYSSYNRYRNITTAQQLYDHYKQFLSEEDNMDQMNVMDIVADTIMSDYSITVDAYASEAIVIDDVNKLITVRSASFKGSFYSKDGMVRLRNNAVVDGNIEDINGCRVRIFSKNGGRFNIVARRQDDNFILADYKNVISCDVYVPRGVDIKFAMWELGYQVYADVIKTDNGGINYYAPMVKNPYINTKIDVREIIQNVRVGLEYPYFNMYFDKAMSIDIEQVKTLIHYIVGSSESLMSSLGTGSEISTIEILKDEIKINLPFVLIKRGGALDVKDRVEVNAYVNVTNAKLLDPNYVINPSNDEGHYVQVLNEKPALDPALLASVVRETISKDLTLLRGQLITSIKG